MTILNCLSGPLRRLRIAATAAALLLVTAAPALGQDADSGELLEDFVHYTRIAKVDLAAAYGQELLESGVTNAELAVLVESIERGKKRFDEAVLRALLVPELEDIAAELGRRVEMGRLDLARDGERIDEAVAMLTGTQRQRLLAKGRLKTAGEFAVPALLLAITDGKDAQLQGACRNMIREIALPAVAPLCAAVSQVDHDSQVVVCDLLGDIGYPHAAPYLQELVNDPATAGPVMNAAHRALGNIGPGETDLSRLFGGLAQEFYDGHGSLIAHPTEDLNNVWSYDAHVGLVATPVPTEIFNEVKAMELASRALGFDTSNREALSLFVASNLKRENDLPAGAADPIYGETRYSPDFFATVFGTQVCQDVLGRAIDTNDTPLVRDAIAALVKTTGGSNLFGIDGQYAGARQPLLEAIFYPDRRVQYESSLTLARALPTEAFEGDYRVVPLLASAVRTGNQAFAVVLADDDENRLRVVNELENLDFTIAGAESSVPALGAMVADAIGVDLIVVRMNASDDALRAVAELRNMPKVAATPILIIASAVDMSGLKLEFRNESGVAIMRAGGGAPFEAGLNALMTRAVGGRMTDAEAEAYAYEALDALEDISISCSPAFNIADAELALLDSLENRTGRARLLVAGIIARIDSDRAQRALFDAALNATGGERIDLLTAVAESVKRYGDRAEARHTAGLLDLVQNATGSTADAAAQVHGALNISTGEAVRLIHQD